MPMSTYGCRGRLAVPELSHGNRFQAMGVCLVQQLWSGAVAGSSRRHQPLLLKYIKDACLFAGSIMYNVLFKDPSLKFVGLAGTKPLQGLYSVADFR